MLALDRTLMILQDGGLDEMLQQTAAGFFSYGKQGS